MPYLYVETKYPQWVKQLRSLAAVSRIEQRLNMTLGTYSTRTKTETNSYFSIYWIPFVVEDVLTLLDYEEKMYAKARSENSGNWLQITTLPRPHNASLLTLPRAQLEDEYIIPAIEASRVEGPEPFNWWLP